jgi:hypothetical protein
MTKLVAELMSIVELAACSHPKVWPMTKDPGAKAGRRTRRNLHLVQPPRAD